MIKRYAKYQFKKWVPLLVIFALVMTLSFAFVNAISPTYGRTSTIYGIPVPKGSSIVPFLGLSIPAFLCSAAMSLFVFSYRTSKQAADAFYQSNIDMKDIRKVRILLGLGILLLSFTIAFLLGFALYAIRYFSTPESFVRSLSGGDEITYVRLTHRFAWYPLFFLLLALALVGQYFMNLFLAGQGNYLFDQLCLLFFGNILLCVVIVIPTLYIDSAMSVSYASRQGIHSPYEYGFGVVTPLLFATALGRQLIASPSGEFIWDAVTLHSGISTILVFALDAFVAVICFKANDPSGENGGLHKVRNRYVALIPHATALFSGIAVSCMNFFIYLGVVSYYFPILVTSSVFSFLFDCLVYYLVLSLWRLHFKLNKFDLKWYFIVVGVAFAFFLFAMIFGLSFANAAH